MNNLDKFFNKKLQNREFEFKDSYWDEAEKMIIADQAGRRWKKGFWFLGALLLVAFTSFFFWQVNQRGTNMQSLSAPDFENQIIENQEQQIPINDLKEKINQNGSKTAKLIEQDKNSKALNSNSQTSFNNQISKPSNTAKNSKNALQKSNEKSQALQNLKTADGLTLDDLKSENEKFLKTDNLFVSQGLNLQDPKQKLAKDEQSPDEEIVANKGLEKSELSSSANTKKQPLIALEPIESISEQLKEPELGGINFSEIGLPKKQRFSLGLTVAGTFNTEQVSNKYWSGFHCGIVSQYRFSNTLSMNLELLYAFQKNLNIEISSSTQTQYSFGLASIIYSQRAESLHFFELPLYLQLRINKHSVEGGVSINYLSAVYGKTIKYRTDPFEPNVTVKVESIEKSWLSEDQFNRLNSSLLLGYRYFINPKFSLGVRASYQMNKLLKRPVGPDLIFAAPGPVQFKVSATRFLFD